jgi:putative ATPase
VSNAGERLGRLRDRVLDAARLQRHHIVLDLQAGSGLLTWEILRRAPEGGTWALGRDARAGEALRQQAARLPEVERPVVLVGEPGELADLLALRGEADLRFDAIVGRNALGALSDKGPVLQELAAWLRPGGRLSLVETVTRAGQRLYELVDLSPLDADLRRRLVEAEEAIYAREDDPLVNWEAGALQEAAAGAGLAGVAVEEETHQAEMLISSGTLDRWFAAGGEGGRPSYAAHLARSLAAEEIARLEALFRRQLTGQAVPWRSRLAFVTAQQPLERG